MSVLSILRSNARQFPRFATLVALTYVVVGISLALTLGVRMAITLLVLCVIIDTVTFMAIRTNPSLFRRCQEAADLIVNYPRSTESESDGYIDEDEGYEEENYDEEPEENYEEQEESENEPGQ